MSDRPIVNTRPARTAWNYAKPVFGIVGAIGAGKSAVAARLVARGGRVLDADKAGHEALLRGDVIGRLIETFGPDVLGETGAIDRKQLAAIVFNDPEQRRRLERIVHPVMFGMFRERMLAAMADPAVTLIALDAAVLQEAGWDEVCDRILYVDAPREQRLERVRDRGWNDEELSKREAAQLPLEEKRRRADKTLVNDGSLERLAAQADELFDRWLAEFRAASGRGNQG